jgi:hypothetical protein
MAKEVIIKGDFEMCVLQTNCDKLLKASVSFTKRSFFRMAMVAKNKRGNVRDPFER